MTYYRLCALISAFSRERIIHLPADSIRFNPLELVTIRCRSILWLLVLVKFSILQVKVSSLFRAVNEHLVKLYLDRTSECIVNES